MAIPMSGYIVVFEAWRRNDSFAMFVGIRTPHGGFELWTSRNQAAVCDLVAIVAASRENGSFYGVEVEALHNLQRDPQGFTTEAPLRKYIGRKMRAWMAGENGWHPVVNDDDTVLSNLVPDRTGTGSSFRPEPAPVAVAAGSQGDNPTFDQTSLKNRLAARRRRKQSKAASEAEMAASTTGTKRVKAFHGKADGIVADLPVIGATDDGSLIPGRIVSNNPAFAVIESGEGDLASSRGPITWVLGNSHNPQGFVVGTTPAQSE